MRRFLAPALLLALLFLLSILTGACTDPDTEGRFDEFLENRDRIANMTSDEPPGAGTGAETTPPTTATGTTPGTSTEGTPVTTESTPSLPTDAAACAIVDTGERTFTDGAMRGFSAGSEMSGEYLLGLRTALDPTPILFRVTITADGDELDLTFQGVLTDEFTDEEDNVGDPRPDARADTGDPLEASTTIDADGVFVYAFTDAVIPGNANPASGRQIVAPTIQITAGACGNLGFCGYVTEGRATSPLTIPLRGYTVAAIAIGSQDIQDVNVVANCEELGEALGLPDER